MPNFEFDIEGRLQFCSIESNNDNKFCVSFENTVVLFLVNEKQCVEVKSTDHDDYT